MSQDNFNCDIIFRRDLEVNKACSFYWIEAFDLIGAGPLRIQKLQSLEAPLCVRLLPTTQEIDAEALREYGSILRLQRFDESKADIFLEFQRQLHVHFAHTLKAAGTAGDELVKKYWNQLPWSGGGLIAHFRYFAGFVKREFKNSLVSELAHWEWAVVDSHTQEHYVEYPKDQYLAVNVSLHAVPISIASDVLSRDKGLYCFVYSPKKNTVVQKRLDPYEAHLVDLLSEDMLCTKSQLLELAVSFEFRPSLSREEWQNRFQTLLEHDIILSAQLIHY